MKCRLTEDLSNNNLLNYHQSAYHALLNQRFCMFIITSLKLWASKKLLLLLFLTCLLPLIPLINDHSILLELLLLLGLQSLPLLSHGWNLNCRIAFLCHYSDNCNSSSYQLLYGVPQGSVLGPLLFILYTTPLSTLIARSIDCTASTFRRWYKAILIAVRVLSGVVYLLVILCTYTWTKSEGLR